MNVTSFWRRGGARKGKLQYAQVMKRVVRVLWEMEVRMVDVVWTPRELNELADRMSKLHLRVPLWVRRDAPWDGGWRSEDWGLVQWVEKVDHGERVWRIGWGEWALEDRPTKFARETKISALLFARWCRACAVRMWTRE